MNFNNSLNCNFSESMTAADVVEDVEMKEEKEKEKVSKKKFVSGRTTWPSLIWPVLWKLITYKTIFLPLKKLKLWLQMLTKYLIF